MLLPEALVKPPSVSCLWSDAPLATPTAASRTSRTNLAPESAGKAGSSRVGFTGQRLAPWTDWLCRDGGWAGHKVPQTRGRGWGVAGPRSALPPAPAGPGAPAVRTSYRAASPVGSGPQQGPAQSSTHGHQSHHSFKSPGLLQYLSRPCRGGGLQGQKNLYINTGQVDGATDVQGLAPEEPALSPSQGRAARGPAGLQSRAGQGLSSRPHERLHSCPRSAHALRRQGHAGSLLSCHQRLGPCGVGPPLGWCFEVPPLGLGVALLEAGGVASSRHVGPVSPSTQWHRPLMGSHSAPPPQSQRRAQPGPKRPLAQSRSQVAPVRPGGQRQRPVAGWQGAPPAQSHCCRQPSPKEPGSHPLSQSWPREPAGHRHRPLTGSQAAP